MCMCVCIYHRLLPLQVGSMLINGHDRVERHHDGKREKFAINTNRRKHVRYTHILTHTEALHEERHTFLTCSASIILSPLSFDLSCNRSLSTHTYKLQRKTNPSPAGFMWLSWCYFDSVLLLLYITNRTVVTFTLYHELTHTQTHTKTSSFDK